MTALTGLFAALVAGIFASGFWLGVTWVIDYWKDCKDRD